jgi:V-type H+-transporting ATPase subunit D
LHLNISRSRQSNKVQVANKKQKDSAAADAEMKKRREDQAADQAARDQENQAPEDTSGPTDLLAAEEDEDVIF